jgi:hypothetical protein
MEQERRKVAQMPVHSIRLFLFWNALVSAFLLFFAVADPQ